MIPDIVNPVEAKIKFPFRVSLATLFHLDGTTSQVKLTFPNVCFDGEMQELTQQHLSRLICEWTRFFIKIGGYQISLGSIDQDGNEHYSINYQPVEIPLGKIYHNGKWQAPEDVKKAIIVEEKRHYHNLKSA